MTLAADLNAHILATMNRDDLTATLVYGFMNRAKDMLQTATSFRFSWQRIEIATTLGSGMGTPGSAPSAWLFDRVLLPPRVLRVIGAIAWDEVMSDDDHSAIFGPDALSASNPALFWFPSSCSQGDGLTSNHAGAGDLRPFFGNNGVFMAAELADRGVSWSFRSGQYALFPVVGQDDPSIKKAPASKLDGAVNWSLVRPYSDASALKDRTDALTTQGYATAVAPAVTDWVRTGAQELILKGPLIDQSWSLTPGARAIFINAYALLPRYNEASQYHLGEDGQFPTHQTDVFTERGDLEEYLIRRSMEFANRYFMDHQQANLWMQLADQAGRSALDDMIETERRQSLQGDAFRRYPGEAVFPTEA